MKPLFNWKAGYKPDLFLLFHFDANAAYEEKYKADFTDFCSSSWRIFFLKNVFTVSGEKWNATALSAWIIQRGSLILEVDF